MPKPILTRVLAVSCKQDGLGREALVYSPAALGGGEATPPAVFVRINKWTIARGCVQQARRQIEDLVRRALVGHKREGNQLEAAARALANYVLPRQGFASLMAAGMHPQFDIVWDAAAEIPWEILEEHFFACPYGHRAAAAQPGESTAKHYCPLDGAEMAPRSYKLALEYHLTHLVRGEGKFSATGGTFLFIEDPDGSLCHPDRDQTGICRSHLATLHDLVRNLGYSVRVVPGQNATRSRVLEEISNPDVAGIYYFGHGYVPRNQEEGCLVLTDESLWASEIKEVGPAARFVFLNACEGAAGGANWDLERRSTSVAEAFAPGGGKVVIASLWPVVNRQAAESAIAFFESAAEGVPLAESLRQARVASYGRYEQGEPHISWMAYRYFGDPNRTLPAPAAASDATLAGVGQAVRCRVFDGEGQLNTEVFGFDVDNVLLRAAKRRNLQNRSRVTFTDFLAGMVRKGDLTRFVLRQLGINPDALYEKLCRAGEAEAAGDVEQPSGGAQGGARRGQVREHEAQDGAGSRAKAEDAVRHELDRWIIRSRSEMTPGLVEPLVTADRQAQERDAVYDPRRERGRINEREVIEALCACEEWGKTEGLPSAKGVRGGLWEREDDPEIDANGHIVLDRLSAEARRVIEIAHVLAQQRGVVPITNRLMLAALLADKRGYAAGVFRAAGLKPEEIFTVMLAATKEDSSLTFGLSPEACERIVLPVIREAGRIAGQPNQVTEKELFRAFCSKAAEGFKEAMKSPPLAFDLDAMGSMESAPEPAEADGSESRGEISQAGGAPMSDQGAEVSTPREDETGSAAVNAGDFDDEARQVIAEAARLARTQGHASIRSPHLFVALITASRQQAEAALAQSGMSVEQAADLILRLIPPGAGAGDGSRTSVSRNTQKILSRAIVMARSKGRSKATVEDMFTSFFADGGGVVGELLRAVGNGLEQVSVPQGPAQAGGKAQTSVLSTFGRDLTEKCRRGEIGEIVGRDGEIETAMQTLLLTESANPLLVGEAGVGKTAIVEGIALRIAQGKCPKRLRAMRIIELSAGSLVADTYLRGQFERRMQEVLAEARGDVILFIDEIHTIVGAGSADGSTLDAANMLKSALARGELHLIGATTPAEYRKTIAKDRALSRRFQLQTIEPPTRDATIQILSCRQAALEKHHGVKIAEPTKAAAADLSKRYIVDKQWPAKARDLLDRACALAASREEEGESPAAVGPEHVSAVVSMLTGIPLERITATEENLLSSLEERVRGRIIGQDYAVKTVADAIKRGRRGLAGRNRPWGVFLFVGPPGVGKTELAKVVAEEVYGGPEKLIRFDMGDFTEPHATAKLLGAPPSYIGYGEGAPLVERLRKRPYSLILFDEIEHAHEDVMAVLLRVLSEGTVEDVEGNLGDARNTIIIMTTNVIDSQRAGQMGFSHRAEGEKDQALEKELRIMLERFLPAKLIDRIDEIVSFRQLGESDLAAIAGLRIEELAKRTAETAGVRVDVAPEVLTWLAGRVAAENAGARGIQRAVDNHVASPLNDLLGSAGSRQIGAVRVSVSPAGVTVAPAEGG